MIYTPGSCGTVRDKAGGEGRYGIGHWVMMGSTDRGFSRHWCMIWMSEACWTRRWSVLSLNLAAPRVSISSPVGTIGRMLIRSPLPVRKLPAGKLLGNPIATVAMLSLRLTRLKIMRRRSMKSWASTDHCHCLHRLNALSILDTWDNRLPNFSEAVIRPQHSERLAQAGVNAACSAFMGSWHRLNPWNHRPYNDRHLSLILSDREKSYRQHGAME